MARPKKKILTKNEVNALKKILTEKGYVTQGAIAEKLVEEGYSSATPENTRTTINGVFLGKHQISQNYAEGIYDICQKDERVALIFEPITGSRYFQISPEKTLDVIFYNHIDKLKEYHQKHSVKERKKVINKLKGLTSKLE